MARKKQTQLPDVTPHTTTMLALATVYPSDTNPREHYDKASLAELAETIKRDGVLQPILVMQQPDGTNYDIIAGERRYRASILAGLDTIPAIIYPPLSPAEVDRLRITENLQRENLTPMEEARALAETHLPAAQLAAEIGRSEKYVTSRLSLLDLPPYAQAAVDSGVLPASTALLALRLDDSSKRRAFLLAVLGLEAPTDTPVAANVLSYYEARQALIDRLTLRLDSAPFDLTDTTLPGGACTACTARTANTPDMFGADLTDDLCTRAACYRAKSEAVRAAEVPASREGGDKPFANEQLDVDQTTHAPTAPREHARTPEATSDRARIAKFRKLATREVCDQVRRKLAILNSADAVTTLAQTAVTNAPAVIVSAVARVMCNGSDRDDLRKWIEGCDAQDETGMLAVVLAYALMPRLTGDIFVTCESVDKACPADSWMSLMINTGIDWDQIAAETREVCEDE